MIMQVLESNSNGAISKNDLKKAVKKVVKAKNKRKSLNQLATNDLCEKIFREADQLQSGEVNRADLRNAIESNIWEFKQIEADKFNVPIPKAPSISSKFLKVFEKSS